MHYTQLLWIFNEYLGSYLKAYLLRQKVGPISGFISFSQMAQVSGRIFAAFIQHVILYETSEYSPTHQRHLGEANETYL